MKQTLKYVTLLAAVLILGACNKDIEEPTSVAATTDNISTTDTTAHEPQGRCYTGVLVIVPADYNPYDHNLETEQHYWGLRINEDTIFRLSRGYNYIYWVWAYQTTHTITLNGQEYNSDDSVTLCGSAYSSYNRWYDEIIYILDLSNSPRTDNLWRPYALYYVEDNEGILMITVDEDNHKLYCTSTYNDMTWQSSLGGGIFRYEETDQTDNLGNPIILVYNDAIQSEGKRFSIAHHNGGAITIRDLDNVNMPGNGQLWLNCSYVSGFETWACDTLGFNIVIHRDIMPLIKYPPHGYSSSPSYVNCTTPFEAGKFYTDYTYSFSPLHYEVSGRTVNFNVEESDDIETVTLTPIGEPAGCLDSYVFHRIERAR